MSKQKHSMQPKPSHDESVRQDFVTDLRAYLTDEIYSMITPHYEKNIEPDFIQANERKPKDKSEVKPLMLNDKGYQSWSLLQRLSQQMMFTSVIDTVERNLDSMIDDLDKHQLIGSLEIDEFLDIPRYLTAYDIHQQPGGYHSESIEKDISAGAVYDISLPIYSRNAMGEENDLLAQAIIRYIEEHLKTFQPQDIMDMGCGIGNSTLPFTKKYPNSKVIGVDVALPCLRYAHARANALGVEAHFSQQNVEKTSYDPDSFDLVTSTLLLHETSHDAVPKIIQECFRLLKPGGWMIHLDVYPFHKTEEDPLYDFLKDWEVTNNNENFSGALRNMNMRKIIEDAGFSPETVEFTSAEAAAKYNKGYTGDFYLKLPVYLAQKPSNL
ncbi:MAG: methyltransferase domain-containing protein [Gammaproteobacteria bacterium]